MLENKKLVTQKIKEIEKIFNHIITNLNSISFSHANTVNAFNKPFSHEENAIQQKHLISYIDTITCRCETIKNSTDELIDDIEKLSKEIRYKKR